VHTDHTPNSVLGNAKIGITIVLNPGRGSQGSSLLSKFKHKEILRATEAPGPAVLAAFHGVTRSTSAHVLALLHGVREGVVEMLPTKPVPTTGDDGEHARARSGS
jgi:hypothetical protein